ncbi:MAG TPA: hypothetical protein VLX92_30440, partial [Kofleriaceae bacterium]|nr:hypothetical protein [Kofleriaceae bacterium]
AEFTDCDFRGADFSNVKDLLGSSFEAVFVRCDLRDTRWQGRELHCVRFVDCKMAGVTGTPELASTAIERPDLSPAGDGSSIGSARDVLQLWGIDPDVPPPRRAPRQRALVYDLLDDEGDHLEDFLRARGVHYEKDLIRRGLDMHFEVRVPEPADAFLETEIEHVLAAYRARRPLEATLDGAIDRGESFEQAVERLITTQGLTREQALEAIIDPGKLRSR